MKNKIVSFVMSIIMVLIISVIIVFGMIIFDDIANTNVAETVQDFVSNQVIVGITKKAEKVGIPEVEQSSAPEALESTQKEQETVNITTNKYFYIQLDNYSRIIYNALESNKEKMKTGTYQINLGTEISELLSQQNGEELLGKYYQSAIEAYTYDNPDVFYLDPTNMYLNIETTTRGLKILHKACINSGNTGSYLSKQYPSEGYVDYALKQVEQVRNYFIENKKASDYENIKMVHDYLVENIDYNDSSNKSSVYDIYGALIDKRCVCEGYAKAFKYLMDALDVKCTLVIGKASNSEGKTENHAWNYVKVNDTWYAIDCTWDDPVVIGGGKASSSSKYKYFLKGEEEFKKTHYPEGQFTDGGKVFRYPQISAHNYND